jgi:ribosome maturation protein SDO1
MPGMRDGDSKKMELGKFIIVRLKKGKKIAEMIVDPVKAWNARKLIDEKRKTIIAKNPTADLTIADLKEIPEIDINDIFEGLTIFEDVHKGEVLQVSFLEQMFETTEPSEIAKKILIDSSSEFQWTKQQREEVVNQKKNQIINILAKNCINPQTKKPHPPARLEKALQEAKYSIIVDKTAEEQIKDVIRAISAVIPIRMENVELSVNIPAIFAPKTYGTIERFGRIKQGEWQSDGSWAGTIDLPAGLEAEFLEKINGLTHGRALIKVLKRT